MNTALMLLVFLGGITTIFAFTFLLMVLSTAYLPADWPKPAVGVLVDELRRRGWERGVHQSESRIRRVAARCDVLDYPDAKATPAGAIATLTGEDPDADTIRGLAHRAAELEREALDRTHEWARRQPDIDRLLRGWPLRLRLERCRFWLAAWTDHFPAALHRVASRCFTDPRPAFIGACLGIVFTVATGVYGNLPAGAGSLAILSNCGVLTVLAPIVWVSITEARNVWTALLPEPAPTVPHRVFIVAGVVMLVGVTLLCLQALGYRPIERLANVSSSATAGLSPTAQTLVGSALMGATLGWYAKLAIRGARVGELPLGVRVRNALRAVFFLGFIGLLAVFAFESVTSAQVPRPVMLALMFSVVASVGLFVIIEWCSDVSRFRRHLRTLRRKHLSVERGWLRPWLAGAALTYFVFVGPLLVDTLPDDPIALSLLKALLLALWLLAVIVAGVQAVALCRWRRRLERIYEASLAHPMEADDASAR